MNKIIRICWFLFLPIYFISPWLNRMRLPPRNEELYFLTSLAIGIGICTGFMIFGNSLYILFKSRFSNYFWKFSWIITVIFSISILPYPLDPLGLLVFHIVVIELKKGKV